MIISRHNQRIKDAVRLRDRRRRDRVQQYLIEGIREVGRALEAGVPIVEVFVAPDLATGEEAARLMGDLALRPIERHDVSREVFEKLAYGDRTEGFLAVARMTRRGLDDLALPPLPVVAVLDGIEKPGNLGAIARSADAAGVAAIVVVGHGTDIYNPNAIRASLGTLFTVPRAEAEVESTLIWAKRLGVPIFAARPDAELLYTQASYSAGAIIVLGSEAHGLSGQWGEPAVSGVRLPMCGVADSLNVSASAAVLFYEALRQRQALPEL
jgi:TrmH family RNA methyltransferase